MRERLLFLFEDRLDLSFADCTFHRGVVLFVLIGIRDRERRDSFLNRVPGELILRQVLSAM